MRVLLALLLLSLTSCSTYNSQFDCKPGLGVGCKSLSTVNELVNDNHLDTEIDNQNGGCKDCKKKNAILEKEIIIEKQIIDNSEVNYQIGDVRRLEEKVIRIWFNDFEDQKGNYNGEQIVYSVLEPSKWVKNER